MCAFALLPLYLGMAAQPLRALRDDAEAGDPASR
jgi:hypothetical protein